MNKPIYNHIQMPLKVLNIALIIMILMLSIWNIKKLVVLILFLELFEFYYRVTVLAIYFWAVFLEFGEKWYFSEKWHVFKKCYYYADYGGGVRIRFSLVNNF